MPLLGWCARAVAVIGPLSNVKPIMHTAILMETTAAYDPQTQVGREGAQQGEGRGEREGRETVGGGWWWVGPVVWSCRLVIGDESRGECGRKEKSRGHLCSAGKKKGKAWPCAL